MDENPASAADVGKDSAAEAVQGPGSDEKQDTSVATAPPVDVGATVEAENDAKRRKIDTDNQEVAASVAEKDSSTLPAVGTSEETKEASTMAQMPSSQPNVAADANVVQQQQQQQQQQEQGQQQLPGLMLGANPGFQLQNLLFQSQMPGALGASQFPAQMPPQMPAAAASTSGSNNSQTSASAGVLPPQLWGPAGFAAASNPLLAQALGLNLYPGSFPPTSGGQTGIPGANPATESAASMPAQNLDSNLTGRPMIQLYMSCDDDSLSEYQCLVRKNIELFEARQEDVESNAQGRNRPIVMGQVGIRCRRCTILPPKHRARGAVYYPAKLHGLYQAAQNMASSHLCEHCQHVPVSVRAELLKLKDRKSSAGGGKKYWADAVRVLGVFEDEDGLRFEKR